MPDFLKTHCDIKSFKYPVNFVKTHKQITIEMSFTLRSVTYKSSSEQKHGSYVRILSTGLHEKSLQFGKIETSFTYQFDATTTAFAIIQTFEDAQHDPDSNLWWVPLVKDNATTILVPLSCLSHPLTIAVIEDENKMWFQTI